MGTFTNKKFLKIISIFLIVITICSFIMPKTTVRAETFTEDEDGNEGRKNAKSNCTFVNVYW